MSSSQISSGIIQQCVAGKQHYKWETVEFSSCLFQIIRKIYKVISLINLVLMGDCCWLKQHVSLGEKASKFEIKWEMLKSQDSSNHFPI